MNSPLERLKDLTREVLDSKEFERLNIAAAIRLADACHWAPAISRFADSFHDVSGDPVTLEFRHSTE